MNDSVGNWDKNSNIQLKEQVPVNTRKGSIAILSFQTPRCQTAAKKHGKTDVQIRELLKKEPKKQKHRQ